DCVAAIGVDEPARIGAEVRRIVARTFPEVGQIVTCAEHGLAWSAGQFAQNARIVTWRPRQSEAGAEVGVVGVVSMLADGAGHERRDLSALGVGIENAVRATNTEHLV